MSNTFFGAEESSANHAFTQIDNKESLPKIGVNEELCNQKFQRLRQLDDCVRLRQKITIFLGIIGLVSIIVVISLIDKGDYRQHTLIHNHPVLDYISEYRVQKGGKIPTPYGDASAVDLSFNNKEEKSIVDMLYQSKREKTRRLQLNIRRIRFILDKQASFPNANLIKFNMRHNKSLDTTRQKEESAAYADLQSKYNLSAYKKELPICAVVRSYNNNAFMRIEYNLNSIFTQNYTNYMAVIINDASNDGSDIVYRKYLDFYGVPKERYLYIQNHERKGALENTYNAIHQVCSNDSIVLVIDGDDELIGKNVFKLYNAFHQKYKGGWIYSNFYRYVLSQKIIQVGYSRDYDLQQKKSVSFRQDRIKCSHLRSFPANLFKKVSVQKFKDKSGNYYQVTEDIAIFLPVAELACGRVYWIPEVTYLYNGDTGLNDWKLRGAEQLAVQREIRNKKKSQCLAEYKQMPLLT